LVWFLILELPFDVVEHFGVFNVVQVVALDLEVGPLELHLEGTLGGGVDHLLLGLGIFRSVRDEKDLGTRMTARRLVVIIHDRVSAAALVLDALEVFLELGVWAVVGAAEIFHDDLLLVVGNSKR